MRLRIIYLLSFLLLLGGRLGAQEAMPLSLEQATDYALKHNASIKNARLTVKSQLAQNNEVTSVALPQLNAKDDFTSYPNQIQSFVPAEFIGGAPGTYVAVPFTPKFSNTASASVSQILFDGGVLVALKAKKTVMQLAELGAKSTEQDVRYNISQAYNSLIVSYRQLRLLNESIAVFQKTANDLEIIQKEGMLEKIEVDRNKVTLNNLHSDSIRLSNMLAQGEQMLKYTMGMDVRTPIILTDTTIEEDISAARMGLLDNVDYNERVEYNLLKTQVSLNQYDLKRYKFAGFPSLSAFGTGAYTYSSNKFSDVATPSNYLFYSVVGATLNVPIFSGFKRANQVKQAKYRLEQSQNNLENMKLAIDLDYDVSKTNLKNALLTYENEQENLKLASSVLDIATKKYKAGVGSSLEINQAQIALLQTQNNYFQALLDITKAKADLQKALGEFSK